MFQFWHQQASTCTTKRKAWPPIRMSESWNLSGVCLEICCMFAAGEPTWTKLIMFRMPRIEAMNIWIQTMGNSQLALEIGSDIEIGKPQFSKSLVSENFEHIPHPEKQYTFKFTKKNLWSQMILHFIHHQKTFTPSHLVCCNAASVFLIKDFKDHPQLLLVEGDDVVPRIGWDVLNLAGAADGAAT